MGDGARTARVPRGSLATRADLHVHAALSSRLGFEPSRFAALLRGARDRGLAALGLVAHLGMPDLPALWAELDGLFPYCNDHYAADGLALYPGIEVDTAEGPHLVALGNREAMLALYARYGDDLAAERFAPAAAFVERTADLELLTICAHPLRPGREIERLPIELRGRFAATELNASDVQGLGDETLTTTRALAQRYGLPVVAGSDAHHAAQVGAVQTRFAEPFASLGELSAQIREGTYHLWVHPQVESMVNEARAAKGRILAEWQKNEPR